MNQRRKVLPAAAGFFLCCLLSCAGANGQAVPFVEPQDGRAPLLTAFDQAQSVDMYLFRLCEEGRSGQLLCEEQVLGSILGVVRRGGTVRVLLEPCPSRGFSACRDIGPMEAAFRACELLLDGGAQVKRANLGDDSLPIRKTHAKAVLLDAGDALNQRAFLMSLNLVPSTFDSKRDYGVLTNDSGALADLRNVFAQDWGTDDPISDCRAELGLARTGDGGSVSYDALIVSPDQDGETSRSFARDKILGLVRSAASSLKIHMEKIDPEDCPAGESDAEILPALLEAMDRGVDVQVLVTHPDHEACDQFVAEAINARAPGHARFQTVLSTPDGPRAGRPHSKMMIVDGQMVFVGSHNLTVESLDRRREIGWVTSDEATVCRFQQVFDADWVLNAP